MTDAHGDGNSSLTFESASFGGGHLTSSGVLLYVKDYLGSVRAVLDADSGALYKAVGYSAYGDDSSVSAIPVLPGGAGAKAAAKADDVIDAARGFDASKNVFKNRVKLRKETKEKIRKNAARDVDGRYIDPNTGMSIEPGQEVFGHKSGQEWRKYKSSPENQNKTRQAVIEEQNNPDIYQIEDRISNASHKYEYE